MKIPRVYLDTEIRAVEMVRAIRDRIYEETKEMSPEEFTAYIARAAAQFVARNEASATRPAA